MEPRNIRVSTSDFGNLRRDGAVYVDKTALVYALAHEDRAIFLSRPRRFGKSLLVSVLEAYFEGRRDLFDGLAVSELETDWIRYPVLKFDLSLVHYTSASDLSAWLNALWHSPANTTESRRKARSLVCVLWATCEARQTSSLNATTTTSACSPLRQKAFPENSPSATAKRSA